MDKKQYETPMIENIEIKVEDVMTQSGPGGIELPDIPVPLSFGNDPVEKF